MEILFTFITYVAALAASVERLVEFVKITTSLGAQLKNPKHKALLFQMIAVAIGTFAYYFAPLENFAFPPEIVAPIVGLLVSAGAGAWHDILSVVSAYKAQLKQQ